MKNEERIEIVNRTRLLIADGASNPMIEEAVGFRMHTIRTWTKKLGLPPIPKRRTGPRERSPEEVYPGITEAITRRGYAGAARQFGITREGARQLAKRLGAKPDDSVQAGIGEILLMEFLRPRGWVMEDICEKTGIQMGDLVSVTLGVRGFNSEERAQLAVLFGTSNNFWRR